MPVKKEYQLEGLTCIGCKQKVEDLLSKVAGVENVRVELRPQTAIIETSEDIDIDVFRKALSEYPAYKIYDKKKTLVIPLFWSDRNAWNRASRNTLNCLIGCSIGDFGMLIYLQTYHHHMNMFLMMVLAIICGLCTSVALETVLLKINERFNWPLAFKTALSMSFLSMLVMELSENITDFLLTGGDISPSEPYYWIALCISLAAGFIVPLPYNYYKLKKYGRSCH